MEQGFTGVLLLLALAYWHFIIRPQTEKRERDRDEMIQARVLAADKLHSERYKELLDHHREAEKSWGEREDRMRNDHSKNFEVLRLQALEQRASDRDLYRELIGQVTSGFDKLGDAYDVGVNQLKDGQDRNFSLTMALAERQGHSKTELAERVEKLTERPVPQKKKYETQHPDN